MYSKEWKRGREAEKTWIKKSQKNLLSVYIYIL